MFFKFAILLAMLALAYGEVKTIGNCNDNDVELSKKVEVKNGEPGIQQEATVQYSDPNNNVITCVKYGINLEPAVFDIVGGGIGQNNMEIHIQSEPSKALSYFVAFYAAA